MRERLEANVSPVRKIVLVLLLGAGMACAGQREEAKRSDSDLNASAGEGRSLTVAEVGGERCADPSEYARVAVSDQEIAFFNAQDATESCAMVQVDGGPVQNLDLRTDEERNGNQIVGWAWEYVGVAPDSRTVVGVLDWHVEAPGQQLHVVTSQDGGHHWTERAAIDKPNYQALFQDLELEDLQWRLTMRLDDCAGCGAQLGETTYLSTDAGRTWQKTDG